MKLRVLPGKAMNKLERTVYDWVKNSPLLKSKIVYLYQSVFGLVPQAALKSTRSVVVRSGYFFGFHDKSPFSPDNSRLLGHRNLIGNRSVRPGDSAEVGFFSDKDWNSFTAIGTTAAWDWQLGSMLQWCGAEGDSVIFNDIVEGGVGSRIVNLSGAVLRSFRSPVVHVSPCAGIASSYCFRRVGKAMNGYGVRLGTDASVPMAKFDCDDPSDFRVFSLIDGHSLFAVSLAEIQKFEPHASMKGAFHFFHHSLFNPSGTRLFFLHRWVDLNGRLWTRMFSCDRDGSALFLFPTHEMVSHVGWVDDKTILAYARIKDGGDGCYFLHDKQHTYESVARQFFNSDGHPMWSCRGDVFVTDSYPDRFRNQYLYIVNVRRSTATTILRTHLSKKFLDDLRVDLHPRFDRTGNVICFDSGHLGMRSLCTVDIGSEPQMLPCATEDLLTPASRTWGDRKGTRRQCYEVLPHPSLVIRLPVSQAGIPSDTAVVCKQSQCKSSGLMGEFQSIQ